MTNTFTLAATHGRMFTFIRSVDGVETDFLRGFGDNEAQALDDARSELCDENNQLLYRAPRADCTVGVNRCFTY